MSLSRPWPGMLPRAGSFGARLGVMVLLALLAAGCGFKPLYGTSGDDASSTSDRLASVRILPLPDRIGQKVHNLLRDRLNPQGQPLRPDFLLEVRLSEVLDELGIRKDETATRANLTVIADFVLRDARTNVELFKGRSRAINSYNILESPFATLFSESDARDRGLREISDEIRDRLAAYFAAIASR